jgi:hypothetical protein
MVPRRFNPPAGSAVSTIVTCVPGVASVLESGAVMKMYASFACANSAPPSIASVSAGSNGDGVSKKD